MKCAITIWTIIIKNVKFSYFTINIRYKTLKPYKLLCTLQPYKPDALYVLEVNERDVFKDPDPKTV